MKHPLSRNFLVRHRLMKNLGHCNVFRGLFARFEHSRSFLFKGIPNTVWLIIYVIWFDLSFCLSHFCTVSLYNLIHLERYTYIFYCMFLSYIDYPMDRKEVSKWERTLIRVSPHPSMFQDYFLHPCSKRKTKENELAHLEQNLEVIEHSILE